MAKKEYEETFGEDVNESRREKAYGYLANETVRRNIRTIATIALGLAIIALYRGFRFGPSLENIFSMESLADTLVILGVAFMVVNDVTERADFDEKNSNETLQELEDDINQEVEKIEDYKWFADEIEKNNEERLNRAVQRARTRKKQQLKIEIAKEYNNPKKRKKLEHQLANVEKTVVHPKKFERYNIDDFLGTTKTASEEDEISIRYQSKKKVRNKNMGITTVRSILLVVFRASLGASTGNTLDMFIFLGLAGLIVLTAGLMNYEGVRYDKRVNEKISLRKKLKILREINSNNPKYKHLEQF